MADIFLQFSVVSFFTFVASSIVGACACDAGAFLPRVKGGGILKYSIFDMAYFCSIFKLWCVFAFEIGFQELGSHLTRACVIMKHEMG